MLCTTGHARACRENGDDRPPRRRFPRAPQRPQEPGQGPGSELRFQGAQAGRQSQQRQVLGAPAWRDGWHRPAARLAPGARPHGGALRGREADAHVPARDHQDAAGESPAGQPAVARQAPALHRARRRGPRRRSGPSLRAADRRGRPRRLQGTLRRRPAPFPLHPLARGWRGAGRPAHLHAAPHGPHGGRPGHWPRLGGCQPLEHRQPAHAHRRARA
ncbi:hypothetical protein Q7C_951 [Methylophaga frappieri]|uniref:Uncharacterized protein n=1 Tax=Methylophaga frappieri (strain ATCC BAA-2434 / DSM 25690 / JAM7) TaxID=754477 RepID=I1YGS7_METFJ|nr:hypothetical protein Q7C_951 [Methylophaga frappieri]